MERLLVLIEKGSHSMSWFDLKTSSLKFRLELPLYPHEFVIDSECKYAYVAQYGIANSSIEGPGGKSVVVVDLAQRKIAHIYDLGENTRPHGIDLDIEGRLYVLSEATSTLLVKEKPRSFDTKWDRAVHTGGEKSHLFALTRDGERAYSMNLKSNSVTVFNPHSDIAPVSISTGKMPEGRALHPDEKTLYVSNRMSNTISVIDTQTLKVLRCFSTPGDPCRVYYYASKNLLVTMNFQDNSISMFQEESGDELVHKKMPARPLAMYLDEDSRKIYVALNCSQVHCLDLDDLTLLQVFETGSEPDVMSIIPS